VVKANWRDNPWFPTVLEAERQLDLQRYPERYHHVWEGDYAKAFEGAYFASVLSEARKQGRITKIAADPILPLRLFWDIGGAGAKADAMAIWIVQWAGQEIRVLDYLEGQGQEECFSGDRKGVQIGVFNEKISTRSRSDCWFHGAGSGGRDVLHHVRQQHEGETSCL
jgi:hypothetical protein